MLIGSFAFAKTNKTVETTNTKTAENILIEHSYFLNENGINTCYARFCWNVSQTQRECSEWVEVPCKTPIEVETKAIKSID